MTRNLFRRACCASMIFISTHWHSQATGQTLEKVIAKQQGSIHFILDTIIHQKIEKVSQKKKISHNLTRNHPIATEIPVLGNG